MNVKKMVLIASLALSAAGAAQANQTWAFSYSGAGVTASGTFVTAGLALAPEDVLSITGTRNGVAITGLVPLDTDPDFLYDNQFTATAPYFTDSGLLYSQAGGLPNVNLYFFGGAFTDLRIVDDDPVEIAVNFSVTAVPEPATVLSMLAGLGLMGVYMRKSRSA